MLKMRTIFFRFYWYVSQFGWDPRKTLRSIHGIPHYVFDLFRFRSNYQGSLELFPCLHDRFEEGGAVKHEYFWQDLLVAQKIFKASPEKHVDIGSRVDGFVAHVASFREIEVLDIRPISTRIPSVTFKQADLMNTDTNMLDYCDSLSCLHALEHFGLGRYGDPIDPKGYELGICNMSKILRPKGTFYLSVPVGIERVEFNAHRVFNPHTIVNIALHYQLTLRSLILFSADDGLREVELTDEILSSINQNRYALGIFIFIKE